MQKQAVEAEQAQLAEHAHADLEVAVPSRLLNQRVPEDLPAGWGASAGCTLSRRRPGRAGERVRERAPPRASASQCSSPAIALVLAARPDRAAAAPLNARARKSTLSTPGAPHLGKYRVGDHPERDERAPVQECHEGLRAPVLKAHSALEGQDHCVNLHESVVASVKPVLGEADGMEDEQCRHDLRASTAATMVRAQASGRVHARAGRATSARPSQMRVAGVRTSCDLAGEVGKVERRGRARMCAAGGGGAVEHARGARARAVPLARTAAAGISR